MDNTNDQATLDVTQTPEAETDVASSSENQTPQMEQSDETETREQNRYVPYDRFTEVNEGYKQSQKTIEQLRGEVESIKSQFAPQPDQQSLEIRQQLQAMGFITKEQQQQELARQKEDADVQTEIARMEQTYNGNDGRPKFNRKAVINFAIDHRIGDLSVAYKTMNEQALTDWSIAQAIAKSRGVKSEASNGSGSSEVGTTNDDLKKAIEKGDKTALKTFLKRQFTKE